MEVLISGCSCTGAICVTQVVRLSSFAAVDTQIREVVHCDFSFQCDVEFTALILHDLLPCGKTYQLNPKFTVCEHPREAAFSLADG